MRISQGLGQQCVNVPRGPCEGFGANPFDDVDGRQKDRLTAEALDQRRRQDDPFVGLSGEIVQVMPRSAVVFGRKKLKPEDRLHLIESVKAEKAAFETRKLIPWSPLMRNAVLAYLRDLASANLSIRKAYDRHISASIKSKDEPAVAILRAEMQAAAPRELLGIWHCKADRNSWTWKIYSDGTFDFGGKTASTGDEWLWALDRRFLTVSTRHAKDPRNLFIDRCQISADGTIFTAENNKKDRFAGRLDRAGY
jgi:hypothetical protein